MSLEEKTVSSIELASYIIGFGVTFLVLLILFYLCVSFFKSRKGEIKSGSLDEELIKDYKARHSKKAKRREVIVEVISSFLTLFFIGCVGVGIYSKVNKDFFPIGNTTGLVIKTNSMEKANKANTYISSNNLTNQFSAYDLIFVNKIQSEEDIKIYDVVVFKYQNILIAHRIIEIVPDVNGKTRYITRGDANSVSDNILLTFNDIMGVYTNQKIPFVGYVVLFLQSPYSLIVLLVLLAYIFILPLFEKKLDAVGHERLKYIKFIDDKGNLIDSYDNKDFITINLIDKNTVLNVLDKKNVDISSNLFSSTNNSESYKEHYQKLIGEIDENDEKE